MYALFAASNACFSRSSYASEVNVVTSSVPFAVSSTPESRSSIAVSSSTRGHVHVAPSSWEVMAWTCPNGHTCDSRPPDHESQSSPFFRRATVGQPW